MSKKGGAKGKNPLAKKRKKPTQSEIDKRNTDIKKRLTFHHFPDEVVA